MWTVANLDSEMRDRYWRGELKYTYDTTAE